MSRENRLLNRAHNASRQAIQDLISEGWRITGGGAPTFWASKDGEVKAVYVLSAGREKLSRSKATVVALLGNMGIGVQVYRSTERGVTSRRRRD